MRKTRKVVREPVQAYLDETDTALLEELSHETSLSKAEVIRRGIRRLAQDLAESARPSAGLRALAGALDSATDIPPDLAARHDEYLYRAPKRAATRRR